MLAQLTKLTFSCLLSPRNDAVLCCVTGLSNDLEGGSLVLERASLSTVVFTISFSGMSCTFLSVEVSCPVAE